MRPHVNSGWVSIGETATVNAVFAAAAVIASPPLLVPELGSLQSVEVAELRAATIETGKHLASLSDHWIAVGVGPADAEIGPAASGSFSGFGVELTVALSPEAGGDIESLPLPVLITGWLRQAAAPRYQVCARLVAAGSSPDRCLRLGKDLRSESEERPGRTGVLIVADGSHRIGTRSPGYVHPAAGPLQQQLSAALAAGDRLELAGLDPASAAAAGIAGRPAYQVLAGLFSRPPRRVTTRYSGAPFGVGYYVGTWQP